MKKEIVYTLPYETERDIKRANDLRYRLYGKYNSVNLYPNGRYEVKIVAEHRIKEHKDQ